MLRSTFFTIKVQNTTETAAKTPGDRQPFIRSPCPPRCKSSCCPSYRLPLTSEKGAIFMIVFNFLFLLSVTSCVNALYEWGWAIVAVLCPLISLAADCWIGKYRLIKIALYVLLLTTIIYIISLVYPMSETVSYILLYIKMILVACSVALFLPCVVHFTTDQLLGQSGEQIGFAVYWLIWGTMAGVLVGYGSKYFLTSNKSYRLALIGASMLSLLIMVLMMECCNHWINTEPRLFNSIRHIARVLNYARKHKYPQRRNAISRWEEDQPSRIDLGKDKYGGPFTDEEVEDVKVMFRLIPVILCAATITVPLCTKRRLTFTTKHSKWYNQSSLHSSIVLVGMMSVIGLPLYQFLIYPFFYNFIPSILQRIGLGLFLQLPSLLCSAIMELPKTYNSTIEPDICNTTTTLPSNVVNQWWDMVPIISDSVSWLLVTFNGMEFVFAQTPYRTRGAVVCYVVGCLVFYLLLGNVLDYFFQKIHTLNCGFDIYIAHACLIVVSFLLFLFASKSYQLRERTIMSHRVFSENDFGSNK